jgi:hypothetical protein
MNGVIFDESKLFLCDQQISLPPFDANNIEVMLFETITALSHTDVLATLAAAECSFTGYARQPVASWAASALTGDFHARAQGATVTFDNSGVTDSGSITGWAMVDVANGVVVQAGLYDTPFVIAASQSYTTTPFWLFTGEIGTEP